MPHILEVYETYVRTSSMPAETKTSWGDKSVFFTKQLNNTAERFDFGFLDPRHEEMEQRFHALAKARSYQVSTLHAKTTLLRGKSSDRYVSSGVPILKVRNVTGEGIRWDDTDFVLREFFDVNPNRHLAPLDVLLTSTGLGTIGRVDIVDRDVPCMTDGHVTVLRVNDQNELSPQYLLYYLRSMFGQMQMERYTVGSTGQTELNRDDVGRMLIIFPKELSEQERLVETGHSLEVKALDARSQYQQNLHLAKQRFADSLGLG